MRRINLDVPAMRQEHADAWQAMLEQVITEHYTNNVDGTGKGPPVTAGDGGIPVAIGMIVMNEGTDLAAAMHGSARPQDGVCAYKLVNKNYVFRSVYLVGLLTDALRSAAGTCIGAIMRNIMDAKRDLDRLSRMN